MEFLRFLILAVILAFAAAQGLPDLSALPIPAGLIPIGGGATTGAPAAAEAYNN